MARRSEREGGARERESGRAIGGQERERAASERERFY
jgi:hypothetical protein